MNYRILPTLSLVLFGLFFGIITYIRFANNNFQVNHDPALVTFSLINYYETPVIVTDSENKNHLLEPFDTLIILDTIALNEMTLLNVTTQDGQSISAISHSYENGNDMLVVKALHNVDRSFCYFKALLSSKNYVVNEQNVISSQVGDNERAKQILLNDLNNIFIFPGSESINDLESDQALYGIYPVECDKVNNPMEVFSIIQIFSDYNPQLIREFLTHERNNIENLTL